MQIAAYVRVSTDDQNEDRQMRAIRQKYNEEENQIDWYCDLGESGASTSRWEYQLLREHNFSSEEADTDSLIQIVRKGYDPPLASSS
jgi:DNA invertase Pin-like site-specific DNA recombinase